MRAVILLLLVSAPVRGDSSVAARRSAALVEVSFYTTPGKPMELARDGEPAEKIVARRDGQRLRLTVSRNVGKQYESAGADLSESEWKALVAVVAAKRLEQWKAVRSGEQGADYSTTGFVLLASDGKPLNQQQWSEPTVDLGPPAALAQALSVLARKKVPAPLLFYLTP